MAKTNDIARLIVDEFEAIEDYRLKDHARIVAKVEQTVRARYPGLKFSGMGGSLRAGAADQQVVGAADG